MSYGRNRTFSETKRRFGTIRCGLMTALAIGLLAIVARASAEPANGPYRLATGDQIAVTVFGHPNLSGTMVVDAQGDIALPLLNALKVQDLTLAQTRNLIRKRLEDGILRHASVSVVIVELRPIYVLGDVAKPGAYPFRFGITVENVVALAGGFGIAEAVRGAALSDFLTADARVRELSYERLVLRVSVARLTAQLAGSSDFKFTPPAATNSVQASVVASAVAKEKAAFDTQTSLLHRQVALLRSQKPRLESEIVALKQQVKAGEDQLDVIKAQVDRYSKLVKRGLGTSTSDFQFRVTQSAQEGSLWRLNADISRLRMEAGNLDIKIQDAYASAKLRISTELHKAQERLNEIEVQLPAARAIREVRLQHAGSFAQAGIKRTIRITRTHGGKSQTLDADKTTPLEPGDTVEIEHPPTPPVFLPAAQASGIRALPDDKRARALPPANVSAAR